MNITSNTQNPNFTSRYNPIKPSRLKTKWGKLIIEEVNPRETRQKGFLSNIVKFIIKNEESNLPEWQKFKDRSNPQNAAYRHNILGQFVNYYKSIFDWDDGNTTLLVARDTNKKIHGLCLSRGFFELSDVTDNACFVDLLYVNKHLRGCKLGKKLLKTTINANKNGFDDIFLLSSHHAKGFYKKMGFETLTPNTETKAKALDFIRGYRDDFDHIVPYNMATKTDKPRWYEITQFPPIEE